MNPNELFAVKLAEIINSALAAGASLDAMILQMHVTDHELCEIRVQKLMEARNAALAKKILPANTLPAKPNPNFK